MLGMAASSDPCLLLPAEEWEAAYIADAVISEDMQPYLRAGESLEQVQEYAFRAKAGFGALQEAMSEYVPDALIVLGCRRDESPSQVATFSFLSDADETGSNSAAVSSAEYQPRQRRLGAFLREELVTRGFDLAWHQGVESPESASVALQALAGAAPLLVISIVINTSTPPLPSAERCWALGVALRDALSTRRERVAILATGGLSHDPLARWVDEPFDRWFLDALEARDVDALTKLFKVDTEVLLGRTGEIRSWITVAGACGVRAGVVDYFAARQARLGVGFSLWQPE